MKNRTRVIAVAIITCSAAERILLGNFNTTGTNGSIICLFVTCGLLYVNNGASQDKNRGYVGMPQKLFNTYIYSLLFLAYAAFTDNFSTSYAMSAKDHAIELGAVFGWWAGLIDWYAFTPAPRSAWGQPVPPSSDSTKE